MTADSSAPAELLAAAQRLRHSGDLAAAAAAFEDAVEAARQVDARSLGNALHALAECHLAAGDAEKAHAAAHEAMRAHRKVCIPGNTYLGYDLLLLSKIHQARQDLDAAIDAALAAQKQFGSYDPLESKNAQRLAQKLIDARRTDAALKR